MRAGKNIFREEKMNKFEFGFCKEDITPRYGAPLCGYFNPRPNTGAYDRLALKAAVFRTGGRSCAAIVSYDLCYIVAGFVQSVEKILADKKSPLAGKVLYCATHTHTGPYTAEIFDSDLTDKDYLDQLRAKTVEALENAYKSLAPAELYTAQTECTTLAFNRRYVMKNGKILTNPGKLNPDIVRPEGGVDHAIMMMEIRQNGFPALLITNISNHTDTIGGNMVSADWPGRMEAEIQHELGFALPVMSIIAPQGNINHFDVSSPVNQTGYEEAKRIGKAYAAAVLAARYKLTLQKDTAIKTASKKVPAPYLKLTDREYAAAKKVYAKYKNEVMAPGRDFTSEDIAKGTPFVMKYFAERAIACREDPIRKKRVETQFMMSFGKDLAIVSLPCEPFIELGMAIRKASKYPMTVLAALGMGEIGYVGLPGNYGNGGYETSPSRGLADRTVGEAFVKTAIELLNK